MLLLNTREDHPPQTPTVTLIFNQARDVNKITLTLWGKELIINHLIKTGDSVEINSELLDVAVNWEWGKDRNWEFWQLMRGENMLTIAIKRTIWDGSIYSVCRYVCLI